VHGHGGGRVELEELRGYDARTGGVVEEAGRGREGRDEGEDVLRPGDGSRRPWIART